MRCEQEFIAKLHYSNVFKIAGIMINRNKTMHKTWFFIFFK